MFQTVLLNLSETLPCSSNALCDVEVKRYNCKQALRMLRVALWVKTRAAVCLFE